MRRLGPEAGWLGTAPGAAWVERDDPNPYVRHRELLWSHHRALAAGWSDADYVARVRDLDAAVAEVDGHGFVVTPYADHPTLSAAVGPRMFVKDETVNVSGSHKARHLFGLALHLALDEATDPDAAGAELAIASCGNAALGAATVARAAGRPLRVFIPTWADPAVVERLEALAAVIEVCPRRPGEDGDPTFLRFREAVAGGARPFGCQGTEELRTIDGGKTLGFELAEAFATHGVPDHLVVQVGGGALGSSLLQGLVDACDLHVIERLPRFSTAQSEGCAPLRRAHYLRVDEGPDDAGFTAALAEPERFMWPWEDEPHSAATGILDDVTYDWLPLSWGMSATGGFALVATEHHVTVAHDMAVEHTPIEVDATGTAGLAGVLHAIETGLITSDDTVAVLFTGHRRSPAEVA